MKRAKKETSDRVSGIGASWTAFIGGFKKEYGRGWQQKRIPVPAGELAAMAASCWSQDETKGKRRKRKAAK